MGDMMKNPEMVKPMEEKMKNPDIMDKAMNMMKDPNMANLFGGSMPNMDEINKKSDVGDKLCDDKLCDDKLCDDKLWGDKQCVDNECCDKQCVDNECCYKTELVFNDGDIAKLINLKSENYNNQECVIKSFNKSSKRYNVLVKSLDKVISVKQENIEQNNEVIIEVD